MMRILATLLAIGVLSACGVRGAPAPAPPMWGEGGRESQHPDDLGDVVEEDPLAPLEEEDPLAFPDEDD